jgi:hypothetical protein
MPIKIVDGKVKCEICGRWLRKLSGHVKLHGMKPDDYKAKFGLRLGESIDAIVNKNGTNLAWKNSFTIKRKRRYSGEYGTETNDGNIYGDLGDFEA